MTITGHLLRHHMAIALGDTEEGEADISPTPITSHPLIHKDTVITPGTARIREIDMVDMLLVTRLMVVTEATGEEARLVDMEGTGAGVEGEVEVEGPRANTINLREAMVVMDAEHLRRARITTRADVVMVAISQL